MALRHHLSSLAKYLVLRWHSDRSASAPHLSSLLLLHLPALLFALVFPGSARSHL